MYLTEPRLFDVVKKQVKYKLNAYTGVFTSLLILQSIGILFGLSVAGNSSYGMNETLLISRENFSNDIPVVFTLIWAFTTGIVVTTKAYRHDLFVLVTNRLSHHLSNFIFLFAAACLAGITMVLSGSPIQLVTFFRGETIINASKSIFQHPVQFLIMVATAVLYTILVMSLGYVIGAFAQRSINLVVLVVIALFITPMLQFDLNIETFISEIVQFFGEEKFLFIFFVKVFATVMLLFTVSIGITNKLEVRK